LGDGEDENLGDVDMRRSCRGPDNFLSNILSRHWSILLITKFEAPGQLTGLQAFVDLLGSSCISAISDDRELGLDHT